MKYIFILLLFISTIVKAQKPKPTDNLKIGIAPAQIKDTAAKQTDHYYLFGTMDDFKLLYKAIADPDNITRKQTSDLAHWVARANKVVTDTTTIKKHN